MKEALVDIVRRRRTEGSNAKSSDDMSVIGSDIHSPDNARIRDRQRRVEHSKDRNSCRRGTGLVGRNQC